MASQHPDALRPKLLAMLDDAEPRVQRAAIVGLGKVGGAGVEDALLALWPRSALPERRALAEALGKIGGEASRRLFEAESSDDTELARRLERARLMLGRSLGRARSALDLDRPLPRRALVLLACRPGLAPVLEDEARARGFGDARARSSSEVVLEWSGPLRPLLVLRTALEVGFELELDDRNDASVVEALHRAAEVVAPLCSQVPRFRLAWIARGHQRERTFRIARALDPARAINDPRGALFEARVGERLAFVLRPSEDLRFGYRGPDVPAASHPTVAAALARVAGAREDDVVWDPFCGSGLELCERGLSGPVRRLCGSDISEAALRAARENLARAGLAAELLQRDARRFAPDGVTLVVTNPPMGRRVARGALKQLILDFLENLGRALAPGARLVWLSPLPSLSAKELGRLGFEVERRGPVDLGGIEAELQVALRRWTSPEARTKIRAP